MPEAISFDPDKDRANVAKHGVSLNLTAQMEVLAEIEDLRFEEPRFRLYGRIGGLDYCVAGTRRAGVIRVISLRRAHAKEMRRYVRKRVTPDLDNPEWTEEDFARARYGTDISPDIRQAFGAKPLDRTIGQLVARQGAGFSRARLASGSA